MSAFLAVLVPLAALLIVWRVLASLFQGRQPAEPVGTDPIEDPFASVPAFRKTSPKRRSGAAAVAEPEDDIPADCFPPRAL